MRIPSLKKDPSEHNRKAGENSENSENFSISKKNLRKSDFLDVSQLFEEKNLRLFFGKKVGILML